MDLYLNIICQVSITQYLENGFWIEKISTYSEIVCCIFPRICSNFWQDLIKCKQVCTSLHDTKYCRMKSLTQVMIFSWPLNFIFMFEHFDINCWLYAFTWFHKNFLHLPYGSDLVKIFAKVNLNLSIPQTWVMGKKTYKNWEGTLC